MGVPDDMKNLPEVDLEINEDSWNSPAGEGLVETRFENGKYKMLLSLGETETELNLGAISKEKGRELHREAVQLLERLGQGAELSSETSIRNVGRRIEELRKAADHESTH